MRFSTARKDAACCAPSSSSSIATRRPPSNSKPKHTRASSPHFGGRPVVIRTLDAGSDKPLRYLALPREENPALGVRGVRASLRNPELLRDSCAPSCASSR
jgi:phosphoenolpyruvate-protein kinase (PTS system EI component)